MADTEVISVAIGRTGLRRTVEMWKFFRGAVQASYVIIPVWLLALIIDIPMTITHPMFAGAERRIGVVVALDLLTIAGLIYAGWWFWSFRPYLKATLKIEDGVLTQNQAGVSTVIELRKVNGIRFETGFFKALLRPAHVLTLRLEEGGEFGVPRAFPRLEYVTDTLATLRPELAAGAVWSKQRDYLVAQDHMMARLNDSLRNPARILTLYIGLPLVLGTLLVFHLGLSRTTNAVILLSAFFFLVSLLIGAMLRRLTDRILRRRLLKQLQRDGKELRRDMVYEQVLALRRFVAHAVILALPILIWLLWRADR